MLKLMLQVIGRHTQYYSNNITNTNNTNNTTTNDYDNTTPCYTLYIQYPQNEQAIFSNFRKLA